MKSVRIALVNDQPLFARGLELLLPAVTESRVSIIAVTDDGTLASGLVRRHRPDIALVDLAIPDPGGVRTIAAIRRSEPDVPVLAMSDRSAGAVRPHNDVDPDGHVEEALEALRAGAVGYLCKTSEPESLIMPLLTAVEGWTVLPRAVTERLIATPPAERSHLSLSNADYELWKLIARGLTVEGIACRMHVSERTAKRLTAGLLRRLNVGSKLEAATLAGRMGLLDP